MQLQQSEIINLAVNIFQNVGIKRYIGQIEALRHEDIYFEIYKIIFPDSMINIFKISESNLSTGQKIQRIIEEISSIIKLDLYHISGEAIAQGNRNHLTNWLQLLQAISNNYFQEYQGYHGGGSEPDRDREMYLDFEEENDYYTVQGVEREFDKHTYTDEKADDSDDEGEEEEETDEPVKDHKQAKEHKQVGKVRENQHHGRREKLVKQEEMEESVSGEDELNRSFRKSDSSRNSNVLKPIEPKKKTSNKKKPTGQNRKVTFKIDEPGQSINKNSQTSKNKTKKSNEAFKATASSLYEPNQNTRMVRRMHSSSLYGIGQPYKLTQSQILLMKKRSFISKMHKIEQQMERKKINDQMTKFQQWVIQSNTASIRKAAKIQQQNQQRTSYISQKIAEREQFINSLAGNEEAQRTMKEIFKKQKQNQRRMRQVILDEERRAALELMDLNFAAEVEGIVMDSIGE